MTKPNHAGTVRFVGRDPTENVIALVESNAQAAAALRMADIKFYDAQDSHSREIGMLRAEHAKELNVAEAKRIDAIRAVDVGAVATAAERAAQQATVLANQVGTSAETLRTLVATTAAAMASAAAAFQSQVMERLSLVEKAQYKGEGRSGLSDPMMAELLAEVKALRTSSTSTTAKGEGIHIAWVAALGAVSLLSAFVAIGSVLYRATPSNVAPVPQVVYVPTPPATVAK